MERHLKVSQKAESPPTICTGISGKAFSRMSRKRSGLARTGWGQGVCVGDVDNDSHQDLFVTYYGQNVLYRNTGRGAFADVTVKASLIQQTTRWNTGCSFVDYDKDGNLDLFVANYVNLDSRTLYPRRTRSASGKAFRLSVALSVFQRAQTFFITTTETALFPMCRKRAGSLVLTPAMVLDQSSRILTTMAGPISMWLAIPQPTSSITTLRNGTFTDEALLTGTAFNKDGKEQGGMGVAVGDYDGDGHFDIVKTNFDGDTPTLYHNNGDGTFFDNTLTAGLGRYTQYVGWGTGFVDIDQDGWLDIFMVNGHIYPEVDQHKLDRSYRQDRQVYMNLRDGTFADFSAQAGPAIKDRRSSRGAAIGDLDGDGSLEIVINNMYDTPSLLKNNGEKGNWILAQNSRYQIKSRRHWSACHHFCRWTQADG